MISFCKTTFKGFYEISLQKHLCHERMVHPLQWWAHPSFEKFLKTEPKFQHVIKWDINENQDRQHFSHMYDVHVASCATFLMRRFFFTSVYNLWISDVLNSFVFTSIHVFPKRKICVIFAFEYIWVKPRAFTYLWCSSLPFRFEIEDLTLMVISYEIYETSLRRVS